MSTNSAKDALSLPSNVAVPDAWFLRHHPSSADVLRGSYSEFVDIRPAVYLLALELVAVHALTDTQVLGVVYDTTLDGVRLNSNEALGNLWRETVKILTFRLCMVKYLS